MSNIAQIIEPKKKKLLEKIADRYHVDSDKMLGALKSTAFQQRNNAEISNEQMISLLIVADQYKLNPFTKEIYAFPDRQNGIVPVVGVDGWSRIINENGNFDGMEFTYSEESGTPVNGMECPNWCECKMYRKDRKQPIAVREYLDEVYRPPFKEGMKGPWQTHTKRMLRHKAMIQCARIAFGFTGIYDPDEAEKVIEGEYTITGMMSGEQIDVDKVDDAVVTALRIIDNEDPEMITTPQEAVDLVETLTNDEFIELQHQLKKTVIGKKTAASIFKDYVRLGRIK